MISGKIKPISAKSFSGVHVAWISLVVSIYIVLVFNISFWKEILRIYNAPDIPDIRDVFFLASILLSLIAATNLALLFFSFRYVFKPVVITLLTTSCMIAYFIDSYGIMMDKGMLQNILETDSREVVELLSLKLFIHFFFFGLLPCLLIGLIKINYRKNIKGIFHYRNHFVLGGLYRGKRVDFF